MFWRYFNLSLVFAMLALWAIAWLTNLIGNTAFIGHISMLALVLASLSSWRSDMPTKLKEGEGE